MIKVNLEELRGGAILAIVMNGHGAYQSVTVFTPYDGSVNGATEYKSYFGPVDIVYSWRATYKMLERKNSGFWTGKPLKSETFVVTDKANAIKIADELFTRKTKVFLNKE